MNYLELHRKLDDAVRITADLVAPHIVDLLSPKSILDVGCGNAVWLAAFGRAGVPELTGLDGDYIDRAALQVSAEHFQSADLSRPFKLNRRFDLVVSLEVGEHLPPAHAEDFVASLCQHADGVLFSAAIPGQGGVGHINEQWQGYWKLKFENHGYIALDAVRPKYWSHNDVVYWYAQNMILYIKESAIANHAKLNTVPPVTIADIVHPRRYASLDRAARAGDDPSLSHLVRHLPRAAGRFVKGQLGHPAAQREPVKLPG
jgi:SAM-dependent methyltransferase